VSRQSSGCIVGWDRTLVSAIVAAYWAFIALLRPVLGRFLDPVGAARAIFLGLIGSSLFLTKTLFPLWVLVLVFGFL
jgi:hypothetical protein